MLFFYTEADPDFSGGCTDESRGETGGCKDFFEYNGRNYSLECSTEDARAPWWVKYQDLLDL